MAEAISYLCKYKVQQLIFMLEREEPKEGDEDEVVLVGATNILLIEKDDNYDENLRTFLKVTLRLDVRKKQWMLKNKRNLICKFELDSIGMDNAEGNEDKFNTIANTEWNESFRVYFSDDDELMDTNNFEDRITMTEPDETDPVNVLNNENYYDSECQLDVYLYNKDLLNSSKIIINRVYTSDTLTQVIGEILTFSEHKNVLMSSIENGNVYKELVVPPLPAGQALLYLEQYYGLYETGAMIYYDVDTLYILNTNGEMTAKREQEIPETMFMVNTLASANPGDGVIKDEDNKIVYININEMSVQVSKYTTYNNALFGSTVKIVSFDSSDIKESESDQSYVDQRNELVMYTQKSDSTYKDKLFEARLEEAECVLQISADNLQLSALTPNKLYKVTFLETSKQERYGHFIYRLSRAISYLTMASDKYMHSHHILILKKVATDDKVNESNN